jgi:hypothetical protein
MIILVLLMLGIVAVPMAVEAVRSPNDNLANDAREEFVESVVRPLERKLGETRVKALSAVEQTVEGILLARLWSGLLGFLMTLLKSFLKFLD